MSSGTSYEVLSLRMADGADSSRVKSCLPRCGTTVPPTKLYFQKRKSATTTAPHDPPHGKCRQSTSVFFLVRWHNLLIGCFGRSGCLSEGVTLSGARQSPGVGLSGFLGAGPISHRELHTDLPSPRAAWPTPGIQPIPRAAWRTILLLSQFFRIQPSF